MNPRGKTLTIFTPTYNRAPLLARLFDSIKNQAEVGGVVEWLLVDDGSTDDTPMVLAEFASERPDLVRYLRIENGGKHRAINIGGQEARGGWIMMVDSDDMVAPAALDDLLEQINQVDGNPDVGMIRGLKSFPEISLVARKFQLPRNPCTFSDWVSAQQSFDSAEVIRRSALLLYPFPDHPGEKFMAEGWLWHRLDETHQTIFVNRRWMDCFYQVDGLSNASRQNRARSPLSAMDVYRAVLSAPVSNWVRSRASVNWWRYWLHARKRYGRVQPASRAHFAFAPFGWLLYRLDLASSVS